MQAVFSSFHSPLSATLNTPHHPSFSTPFHSPLFLTSPFFTAGSTLQQLMGGWQGLAGNSQQPDRHLAMQSMEFNSAASLLQYSEFFAGREGNQQAIGLDDLQSWGANGTRQEVFQYAQSRWGAQQAMAPGFRSPLQAEKGAEHLLLNQQAFTAFDRDNDGQLTQMELLQAARERQPQMTMGSPPPPTGPAFESLSNGGTPYVQSFLQDPLKAVGRLLSSEGSNQVLAGADGQSQPQELALLAKQPAVLYQRLLAQNIPPQEAMKMLPAFQLAAMNLLENSHHLGPELADGSITQQEAQLFDLKANGLKNISSVELPTSQAWQTPDPTQWGTANNESNRPPQLAINQELAVLKGLTQDGSVSFVNSGQQANQLTIEPVQHNTGDPIYQITDAEGQQLTVISQHSGDKTLSEMAKLLDYWTKLPDQHKNSVSAVKLAAQPNGRAPAAFYRAADDTITFFQMNEKIFNHEWGHAVGYENSNTGVPQGWSQIVSQEGAMTTYGHTNLEESWAEASSAYLEALDQGPQALAELEQHYPGQFGLLQQVYGA